MRVHLRDILLLLGFAIALLSHTMDLTCICERQCASLGGLKHHQQKCNVFLERVRLSSEQFRQRATARAELERVGTASASTMRASNPFARLARNSTRKRSRQEYESDDVDDGGMHQSGVQSGPEVSLASPCKHPQRTDSPFADGRCQRDRPRPVICR
jgi:hypothetical protein